MFSRLAALLQTELHAASFEGGGGGDAGGGDAGGDAGGGGGGDDGGGAAEFIAVGSRTGTGARSYARAYASSSTRHRMTDTVTEVRVVSDAGK